jgi:hypothetical protein
MTAILNAAPMTNMLGVQDLSARALVLEPEALPTHLPKIYLYTQKGPTTPQLVSGASLVSLYGADSFDARLPWATHATEMAKLINSKGNALMVQRVMPDDAAPPATIRLMLDVLPTNVQQYERNSDGSITTDVNGDPVAVTGLGATLAGYRIKWVAIKVPSSGAVFGAGTIIAGDMVDGETNSQRYPIADLEVSHFGAYGNDRGLSLWQPFATSTQPLDTRLLTSRKVMPFRMACKGRANSQATGKTIATLQADQYVTVTWKKDTIDPNTDSQMYIGDVFLQAYQDLSSPGVTPTFGPFGRLHMYDANIATVLDLLYTAELAANGDFTDLPAGGTSVADKYLINMISASTSEGAPYYAIEQVASGTGAVRPSENTIIYALGGADGTMTEADFGVSVAELVTEYGDENSPLQDTAKYPESIMYDSGFPLDTKKAMCSFISVRKDTAVVLSTYDTAGQRLTASQESSLAVALRTQLQLFPESEYYGTSTMRGMVVGRNGKMFGSQYKGYLPLTFEIASKAAEYMGAANGKWKPEKAFDIAPANQVNLFSDVNITFTPAKARNKDWDNGLVWVENFDRSSLYFPALQTVYDDDTSVLNSFFTMMACVELEKVGDRARRAFSGSSKLTNAQIIERVNKFVEDNTTGRFDGRFVIVPNAYFTDADIARGYSWTLAIKIYAPNMKTVQTLTIEAHRIEELAA